MAKETKLVAEIALYGAKGVGHGFIAAAADGRMFGDGEPCPGVAVWGALWAAETALLNAGVPPGPVEVHWIGAHGEPLSAVAAYPKLPHFEKLAARAAPGKVLVLSAEAILAAAVPPEAA